MKTTKVWVWVYDSFVNFSLYEPEFDVELGEWKGSDHAMVCVPIAAKLLGITSRKMQKMSWPEQWEVTFS
jgi:hypothetical protein